MRELWLVVIVAIDHVVSSGLSLSIFRRWILIELALLRVRLRQAKYNLTPVVSILVNGEHLRRAILEGQKSRFKN